MLKIEKNVKHNIQELIQNGVYPSDLWGVDGNETQK